MLSWPLGIFYGTAGVVFGLIGASLRSVVKRRSAHAASLSPPTPNPPRAPLAPPSQSVPPRSKLASTADGPDRGVRALGARARGAHRLAPARAVELGLGTGRQWAPAAGARGGGPARVLGGRVRGRAAEGQGRAEGAHGRAHVRGARRRCRLQEVRVLPGPRREDRRKADAQMPGTC